MNTKIFDIELYPINKVNEKFGIKHVNVIEQNPTGYLSYLEFESNQFPQHNMFEMLILSNNKIHCDDFYIDDCGELRQSVMVWDKDYWKHRQNYRKIEATLNFNTTLIPKDLVKKFMLFSNQSKPFHKISIKCNNTNNIVKNKDTKEIDEYFLLSDMKTYSENEVLSLLQNYDREFKLDTFAYTKSCDYTVIDWFNKNKK